MQAMRVVVLVAAVALFGCGGAGRFVQRGINAYDDGDYPLAMEHFAYIESEEMDLNPKGEVRYLVYKGLALVHLGRRDEGLKYLVKGREAYRAGNPRWLPQGTVAEMDQTLAQFGVR